MYRRAKSYFSKCVGMSMAVIMIFSMMSVLVTIQKPQAAAEGVGTVVPVPNADFSNFNNGEFAGWTLIADPATQNAALSQDDGPTAGSKSAKITVEDAGYAIFFTGSIPIEPSTKYKLSVWVKTENTVNSANYFMIRQDSLNGEQVDFANTVETAYLNGPTGWTQLVYEFTSHEDAAKCVLHIMYDDTGTFEEGHTATYWYADLVLLDMSGETEPGNEELVDLPNADFSKFSGTTFPDWTFLNLTGGTDTLSQDDGPTPGSKSAKITVDANGIGLFFLSSDVELEPETIYRLSVWIKAENTSYTKNYFCAQERVNKNDDSAGTKYNTHADSPFFPTNEWRQMKFTFVSSTDMPWCSIQILFEDNGDFEVGQIATYWFADLKMEKLSNVEVPEEIPNLSFEDVDGGVPESWTAAAYNPTGFIFKSDDEYYRHGKHSAYLKGNMIGVPGGTTIRHMPLLPVEGATYYKISGYFRSRNSTGSPWLKLFYDIYNSDNVRIGTSLSGEARLLNGGSKISEWSEISQIALLPPDAAYIQIHLGFYGGAAELWLDDFSIMPVRDARDQEMIIEHGDFRSVDEAGNIGGWSTRVIKGSPVFSVEEGTGDLTVPSGGEGYYVMPVWKTLGNYQYKAYGRYKSSDQVTAIIKFYDYNDRELTSLSHVETIPASAEWASFDFDFIAPSHTRAEIWLGSSRAGEYSFDDVGLIDFGSVTPMSNWEGKWVWYPENSELEAQFARRYFRHTFYLEDDAELAPLQMTADDNLAVWVNGQKVWDSLGAPGDTWAELKIVEIQKYLKKGDNIIAFEVQNNASVAGLLYDCRITMKNGNMFKVLSDIGSAVSSRTSGTGWTTLEFDDSDWRQVTTLGQVGASPWGVINFDNSYYINCLMEIVSLDVPASAEAGTAVDVTAVIRLNKPVEKNFALRFIYWRRHSIETMGTSFVDIVSGGSPTSWEMGKDITLKLRFNVPEYLEAMRYDLQIDTNNVIVSNEEIFENKVADIRITTDTVKNEPVNAVLKDHNGSPTIFVNGKPKSSMFYLRWARDYDFESSDAKFYEQSGIDMYITFRGWLSNRFGGERIWRSDGTIDYSEFDKAIFETLSATPDAYLMVNLALNVPDWWLEKYPDEEMVASTGRGLRMQSYSSELYREQVGEVVKKLVEHMLTARYRSRIYGVRICGGESEWFYEEDINGEVGARLDYSKPALAAFKNYLKQIYENDVSKLRAAWNDQSVTFDTVTIPTISELAQTGNSQYSFRDPVTQRKSIDYSLFLNEAVTDCFLHFSKIIKDTCNNNLIVGGYYGYLWGYYSGYGVGQAASTAMQRVLKSPYVDFIATPMNYGWERDLGQTGHVPAAIDGTIAHGKLFIKECDNRTVTGTKSFDGETDRNVGETFTMRDTLSVLKRDFNDSFIRGSGVWFYEMYGQWFTDDQLFGAFRQMKSEMDFALNRKRVKTSEVALFIDEELVTYMPLNVNVTSPFIFDLMREQRTNLSTMGAPYDVYSMGDLEAGVVPDYKINIMLSPVQITDKERDAIDQRLKKDGKTIIWIYQPAISDGSKIDIERASEIIGINLGFNSFASGLFQTQIADVNNPIVQGLAGFRYGTSIPGPGIQMFIDDPQATILGHFVGTTTGSLAVKDMGNWTSIYSSSPNLSNELLRNILKNSGIHIYSENNSDVIYANNNYVSLHSLYGGTKTIKLDGNYSVYDVYAEKFLSMDTDTIVYEHKMNETKLFRLMTKNTVAVTVEVDGEGGTVSPSGLIEVPVGEKLTLTFTPDKGYKLGTVTVNGIDTAVTKGKLILSNLTENQKVVVKFISVDKPDSKPSPSDPKSPSTGYGSILHLITIVIFVSIILMVCSMRLRRFRKRAQ